MQHSRGKTRWREPNSTELARRAGLRYVDDSQPGYSRQRWGRGFTWRDERGEVIKDRALRQQLIALTIPPAWQEVWICPQTDGHLLATGRDTAGRKQYLYHPKWESTAQALKFERLVHFGEALPELREHVEQDLGQKALTKEKVTAVVIRLLDETGLRIGHDSYTEQHGSYGLTTLCEEHLTFQDGHLLLEFIGKSQVERRVPITDRELIQLIELCADIEGERLFQYKDEAGELLYLTSSDVNAYLQRCTEAPFTSKDFRTWMGTVSAVEARLALGEELTGQSQEALLNAVIDQTAGVLGNTPAVCRDYYVHPAVLESFGNGRWDSLTAGSLPQATSTYSSAERLTLQLLDADPI